ncbi:MAG: YkgJ family cysteine cluster protein [Nitrososphaerota archaeon]|nr:YkgJ family cysteine cluster protein [Nitrososphaerota archaeon]
MKPPDAKVLLMPIITTFYVHIEFKIKTGIWSVNLPFLCSKCGVCCTLDDFLTAGKLKISPENPTVHVKAQTLYEELGRRWEADPVEYDRYITTTSCPFLFGKICSIYEIRPEGCRQFPNTPFGMQTQNCEALTRFKRQLAVLRKGRTTEIIFCFIERPIMHMQCTVKQYRRCVAKLCSAGITDDELALFCIFNEATM